MLPDLLSISGIQELTETELYHALYDITYQEEFFIEVGNACFDEYDVDILDEMDVIAEYQLFENIVLPRIKQCFSREEVELLITYYTLMKELNKLERQFDKLNKTFKDSEDMLNRHSTLSIFEGIMDEAKDIIEVKVQSNLGITQH